MSKKRITIVAIVLFLLIGLTIFTFANKGEDDKLDGKKENKTEIKKEEDDEENDVLTPITTDEKVSYNETKEESTPVSTVSTVNTNNAGNVIAEIVKTVAEVAKGEEDDGYLKALTAVVSAENTINNDSYEKAKQLVDKVTNESKKENLNARLDEVKKAIDADLLLQGLEDMVNSINSKEDLDAAREYRNENKVNDVVNEINLDSAKEDLEKRLEELSKLLDDLEAPRLSVENNKFYNEDVVITGEDVNEFTLSISKDAGEYSQINNNTTIEEEGVYILTAVDKAFNEVTVTFTIDKTAPVIIGTEDNKYYNKDVTYEVTTNDETEKDFAIKEKNPKEITIGKEKTETEEAKSDTYDVTDNETELPTTITEEGTYTIKAKDEAGNESVTLTFTIDKTRPTATLNSENQSAFGSTKYVVTMETSEPISSINNHFEEWTKIDDTHYTRVFEGNNVRRSHSLKITDLAGNVSHTIYYNLW